MKIDNVKWALITGASGGFGKEFAMLLAEQKISLVLVARTASKLNEVAAAAQAKGSPNVHTIVSDLSHIDAPQKIFDECKSKGLAIDFLVNNAGVGMFGNAIDLPLNEINAMLTLNINSLIAMTTLFAKEMQTRKHGKILNVASVGALSPFPHYAAYAASKSFVLSYSLAIRQQLAPFGIEVTCTLPGASPTDFADKAGSTQPALRKRFASSATSPIDVARYALATVANNKAYEVAGPKAKKMVRMMSLFNIERKAQMLYKMVTRTLGA